MNAMQCAIVDVAHSLVEHFLQTDEPERARAAAETALFAAPTDAIPKLDLAKVARHGGHHDEAKRLALEVVRDSETDGVPDDLDQRTAQFVSELVAPTRPRRPSQVAS